MTVKLFYQSLGVARQSESGAYAQALTKILQSAAAQDTSISLRGLGPGKAIADQYRFLELLDTCEILDNGLRAEQEGFDAFLIGNIFDPGLHALREALNIPVLGLCESSIHLACLMGASFSIVNVNAKFTRRIVENIAGIGLSSRLISIDEMQIERGQVLDRAFEDDDVRKNVLAQFTEVARQGAAKGAEVIIPAGGIVMTILACCGVFAVDNVPIVNGLIALVKMAELAVQIRRLTGSFTSKRLMYAPPTGKLLQDIRQAYGNRLYPDPGAA